MNPLSFHLPRVVHVRRSTIAAAMAAACAAAAPAWSATTDTFTGRWAPTAANGFGENTAGSGTFATSVSPDGRVLTSALDNNGDFGHASFFLENYSFLSTPLLPTGRVSYDFSIRFDSPTGMVAMFSDFPGHDALYNAGDVVTGHVDLNYTGGYFSYFGVNIDDGQGTARAVVTLSNFSAPVPEPASAVLAALGLGVLGAARRRAGRPTV